MIFENEMNMKAMLFILAFGFLVAVEPSNAAVELKSQPIATNSAEDRFIDAFTLDAKLASNADALELKLFVDYSFLDSAAKAGLQNLYLYVYLMNEIDVSVFEPTEILSNTTDMGNYADVRVVTVVNSPSEMLNRITQDEGEEEEGSPAGIDQQDLENFKLQYRFAYVEPGGVLDLRSLGKPGAGFFKARVVVSSNRQQIEAFQRMTGGQKPVQFSVESVLKSNGVFSVSFPFDKILKFAPPTKDEQQQVAFSLVPAGSLIGFNSAIDWGMGNDIGGDNTFEPVISKPKVIEVGKPFLCSTLLTEAPFAEPPASFIIPADITLH